MKGFSLNYSSGSTIYGKHSLPFIENNLSSAAQIQCFSIARKGLGAIVKKDTTLKSILGRPIF